MEKLGNCETRDYRFDFFKQNDTIYGCYSNKKAPGDSGVYRVQALSKEVLQRHLNQKHSPYIDLSRKIIDWIVPEKGEAADSSSSAGSSSLCLSSQRDIDGEEEAYISSLEQLSSGPSKDNECPYIEKLGDLYRRKGELEAYIQAAGLYNYVYQVSKDSQVRCRMRRNLVGLEKSLLGKCSIRKEVLDTFERNRERIKGIREKINPQVLALPDDPPPEKVHDIHKEIAVEMKGFLKELIDQCTQIMGTSPCNFAVIGLGSLAREEMTPYSDFEFAVLLEKETDEIKKYFTQLTYLLHLKVVNLGETILPTLVPNLRGRFYDSKTPRGLAFDGKGTDGKGCKTPLGNGETFTLLHTPEKMAELVGQDKEDGRWWFEKEPHLPMEMLNFTHIIGHPNLSEEYQKQVNYQLSFPAKGKAFLREYLAKNHLREDDNINFDPTLGKLEDEGKLFQVKQDLYRLPHLAIERLSMLLKVQSQNTFERIGQLCEKEVITDAAKSRLSWLISEITKQRLKVYAHYKKQCEDMNPLLSPFVSDPKYTQFALKPKELENLTRIYQILIPFYHGINNYLDGNVELLPREELWDNKPETLGKIAFRLLQYQESKKYYLQAVEEAPEDASLITQLGVIYSRLSENPQAIECMEKALAIREEENRCRKIDAGIAASLINLGYVYAELGKYDEALKKCCDAKEIAEKLPDEHSFGLAKLYTNLGDTLGKLGKHVQACEFHRKGIGIVRELFGDNHPNLAMFYNNLAHNLGQVGKYHESLEENKKAYRIWAKVLGEYHPILAITLNNMGHIYEKLGYRNKALKVQRQALKIGENALGHEHLYIGIYLDNIATILSEMDRDQEALENQTKAFTIKQNRLHGDHPELMKSLNTRGLVLEKLSRYQESLECLKKAFEMGERCLKKKHPDVLAIRKHIMITYNNVIGTLNRSGKYKDSIKYSIDSVMFSKSIFGWHDRKTQKFFKQLIFSLRSFLRDRIQKESDINLVEIPEAIMQKFFRDVFGSNYSSLVPYIKN